MGDPVTKRVASVAIALFPVAFWCLASCASAGREEGRTESTDRAFNVDNARILNLTLRETKLEGARRSLGPATIVTGRGEGEPRELCYRSAAAGDETVLVLEADAMGGWETITGFRLLRASALADPEKCLASAKLHLGIATRGGVRLGLSRREVVKLLGEPTSVAPRGFVYAYSGKVRMTAEQIELYRNTHGWDVSADPYFDEISEIRFQFDDDRAVEVGVFHVLAY